MITLLMLTASGAPTVQVGGQSLPDPWRWLEDDGAPEVERWLAEQASITRARFAELELPAARRRVESALAARRERQLVHARGETLLWRVGEPRDGEEASRFEVAWGDAPPAPIRREDGAVWAGVLCALSLSPSGRRVVLGERARDKRGEEACALSVFTDDGRSWEVPAPAGVVFVSWEDEETLFVSDRQSTYDHRLLRVPLDGAGHEVLDRTSWPAWVMPVGEELLVVQEGPGFELLLRGRPGHFRPVRCGPACSPTRQDPLQVVGTWRDEVLIVVPGEGRRRVVAVGPEGEARDVVREDPEWRIVDAWRHGDGVLVVSSLHARLAATWVGFDGGPARSLPLPDGAWVKAWPGRTHVGAIEVAQPGGGVLLRLGPDLELSPIAGGEVLGRFLVVDTPGEEGTIPVSLWLPEGRAEVPLWAHVYGGFGAAIDVRAGLGDLAWVQAGGGVAWLHVRGGSELGAASDLHGPGARLQVYGDAVRAIAGVHAAGVGVPGEVIVSGFSNGGVTALGAAFLAPERFAAVIAGSGPYDLLRGARFPGWWWPQEYGRVGRRGQADDILAAAPLLHIPPQPPPLLLHTGEADGVVPPAHARKATAALRDAGAQVWLRVWPWMTHSREVRVVRGDQRELVEVTTELLAFAADAVGLELGAATPAQMRAAPAPSGCGAP
jgi:dipeptidyl aminopeptidase/acylaminoacyl peptidase